MKKLVQTDADWLNPSGTESEVVPQAYVRLAHISTDDTIGVKSPNFTKLIAMINVNSHKKEDLSLVCEETVQKNWPLGHGAYRISGNFGPLVPVVREAHAKGHFDALWLNDGYIKEATMHSVFVLWKSRTGKLELITPPLDGCVYEDVLRDSIL